MKAGLYQEQALKVTMTQSLSQAISLLQYSSQELATFLENKWLENPLLLLEEPISFSQEDTRKTKATKKNYTNSPTQYIEQIGEESFSLENHLLSQLDVRDVSAQSRILYLRLIRNIDDNGYMRAPIEEIAESSNVSTEEAIRCLKTLQQLEPYGIGARNLQECLLIQTKKNGKHQLAEDLLKNHFTLFAEKKWKVLAKILNVSLKEIQLEFDFVQTLNPRPGAIFTIEKPTFITPDVVVTFKEGTFEVVLDDRNFQGITVNQSYVKQMQEHHDQSVNHFLQEKWQEFQWILKGIQQRKDTILRVMQKIVEKQPNCFKFGLDRLDPMTMKEIADELGIHESTVSRTVKGKYVQTPFGTIEMRSFFTSSLQSTFETDVSGTKVKNVLVQLIADENKQKPLSDQDLVKVLHEDKGIILSRRTVAKYREQLQIPPSTKRKRYE